MRRFLLFLVWATTFASSDARIVPIGRGLTGIRLGKKSVLQGPKRRQARHFAVKEQLIAVVPRGGACDTNPVLAIKMGIAVAIETLVLMGVIAAGKAASPTVSGWLDTLKIPSTIGGLPVAQWIALFLVIFNSSFIASFVEGSMSAATNQVLKPDVVPGDPSWYADLNRPSWEPPGWVFPIMWLIVAKPTQLLAVGQLLKSSAAEDFVPWTVLAVYCEHLALGDAWNRVFFGCQRIGLGTVVISVFYGFLLWATRLFASRSATAGKLMLPTCVWVLVATALQWSIYLKNKT